MSYNKPFTKNCDTCGQKIGFSKHDGRTVPVNADGSVHHCQKGAAQPKEDARIGIYGGVSRDNIKLTVKSGGILMSEATADLLKCLTAPDAAIKSGMRIKVIFGKDGKAERVEACPDQPAPVTTEQEPAPHQDTCTSPETAPASSQDDQDVKKLCDAFRQIKQEDQVHAAMSGLMLSDRVGYRISLTGMVNSVIEMKKISNDAPKTYAELEAEVKRDAVALFVWCDGLTTQKLGKEVR